MNGDKPEPVRPEDVQERIRELAYAMWETGGHQHGRALEYWLEAERRLLAMNEGETASPPAAAPEPAATPPEGS